MGNASFVIFTSRGNGPLVTVRVKVRRPVWAKWKGKVREVRALRPMT
jgi:hypothetical protein